MDKVRRVLVYICKDRAVPHRAQFVQVSFSYNGGMFLYLLLDHVYLPGIISCQSVTGEFIRHRDDEAEVNCSLEKNQFLLFRADKSHGIPLKVKLTPLMLLFTF